MCKIFTYLIRYNGIDEFGSIEFCVKNRKEAVELFREWCINDMGTDNVAAIKSIETVYNEHDAIEYGKEYNMMR